MTRYGETRYTDDRDDRDKRDGRDNTDNTDSGDRSRAGSARATPLLDDDLREWLRALGMVAGLVVQAEYLYDMMPDEDERVHDAYDEMIEAMEHFAEMVRQAAGVSADDE